MSYVLDAMSLLEDQWTFGTIGDKPKSDIGSRISSFVNHPKTQQALGVVKDHHRKALTTALALSLTHVAPHHADTVLNPDIEQHVHHQIEHLGQTLSISKTMAHGMLTSAVGKLKEMRGIKEDQEKDDELDSTISKLHKLLKKLEPHYNPKSSKEEPKPKPQGEPK